MNTTDTSMITQLNNLNLTNTAISDIDIEINTSKGKNCLPVNNDCIIMPY